jgi:colicin import membrane protein
MNRIQKKCFVAATGFHLLLLLILFVGPAFLSSNQKADDRPLIDFVPLKTIDEALSGGGNPNARPPEPQPQPPEPQPQPQLPVPKAQPPPQPRVQQPEPPKPVTRDRDSFDTKPVRKLPDVSLKPVTKPLNKPTNKPSNTAESDSDAKARADAAKRKLLANAARDIREGASGSTTIELDFRGPGGGGVPYANFLDAVKKIYSDAWLVPDSVTDDEATTTASVTIARDGTVVSSRIIRPSGNALADASVDAALRRVTHAVPLPDGAKENQRAVTIKFNVKAKRGLG